MIKNGVIEMKKATAILTLFFLLCFTGCAASDPSDSGGRLSFTYHGIRIELHGEAAPVIAALGEPKSYTEEASCAFDGLDKTYYYGSFYLTTYPMDGKDYVYSLWFADDSISTEEGIRIGNTQTEVESICGTDSFNGTNAYTLTKNDTRLTVILTDGTVSSIQYQAIIE